MTKNDIEIFTIIGLCVLSVVLFIWIPPFPVTGFDMALNSFVDQYLFGNGYYKPTRYPFTSKVVNGFSTAAFLIAPLFFVIWNPRKKLYENPSYLKIAGFFAIILLLFLFMLYTSMYPQEFAVNLKRRTFGRTEAFHNSPFQFMLFMLMKNFTLYICIRGFIQVVYGLFSKIKTKRLEKAWAKKQEEWRNK